MPSTGHEVSWIWLLQFAGKGCFSNVRRPVPVASTELRTSMENRKAIGFVLFDFIGLSPCSSRWTCFLGWFWSLFSIPSLSPVGPPWVVPPGLLGGGGGVPKHVKYSEEHYIYQDNMQPANCWGSPLYQATKRHLNNSPSLVKPPNPVTASFSKLALFKSIFPPRPQ